MGTMQRQKRIQREIKGKARLKVTRPKFEACLEAFLRFVRVFRQRFGIPISEDGKPPGNIGAKDG